MASVSAPRLAASLARGHCALGTGKHSLTRDSARKLGNFLLARFAPSRGIIPGHTLRHRCKIALKSQLLLAVTWTKTTWTSNGIVSLFGFVEKMHFWDIYSSTSPLESQRNNSS